MTLRNLRKGFLPLLLSLSLLLGGAMGEGARAQDTGESAGESTGGLKVEVRNGTPGGGSVPGLPLTVYEIEGEESRAIVRGETDDQGRASWPDFTGKVSARYAVSTTFQGVAYTTEPAALPDPAGGAVVLPVFDASSDDTGVRVATMGMVIIGVDAPTQQIQILETLTLRNDGVRTFLPGTGGPRGPMGLLRFGLPEGAGNLTPDGRLAGHTIIQVETGFATDLPVPPGDTDVTYTYEVAYGALAEGGYALLTKNLPYPTELLRLLSVPGDFTIQSAQLADRGLATVGSRQYRQHEGRDLPARSEISVELRNLPLMLPALRPGNPWLQVIVGMLLLLAVTFPIFYARRAKTRPAMASTATAAQIMVEADPPQGTGTRPPRVRQVAHRPSTRSEPGA